MVRSTKNFRLLSAAGTNATSVFAANAQFFGGVVSNTSAGVRYLKIYDKASAPVVGTDIPVLTILIAAGVTLPLTLPNPLLLATGLALAITGLPADADATAVALNDVIVNLQYGIGKL